MPGKLDEISRTIGAVETAIGELRRRADEDRDIRDRWHAENRAAIATLTQKLDHHADAVDMLRPAVAAAAVTVLLALVMWFGAELITGAGQAGLAERVAGAAQALWPLAVVLSCWRRPARVVATVPSPDGRDDGH